LYSTCKVTVKNWHLSVFGYKIAYNTSLFGFKSIITARGGTGGMGDWACAQPAQAGHAHARATDVTSKVRKQKIRKFLPSRPKCLLTADP